MITEFLAAAFLLPLWYVQKLLAGYYWYQKHWNSSFCGRSLAGYYDAELSRWKNIIWEIGEKANASWEWKSTKIYFGENTCDVFPPE